MNKGVLLFFFLITLASCGNRNNNIEENSNASSTTDIQTDPVRDLSGCYLRVLQRDTLALRVEQEGNTISGKLTFDNFEKDGSSGTVKGTVMGDVLKLIYDFQSEGMHSVMDVYFKVADGGLIHGIGEVNVKTDTTYFIDTTQINYPEANRLLKVACASLPSKYK